MLNQISILTTTILIIASINVGIRLGKTLTVNTYNRSIAGIVFELDKSIKKNDMEELKNKVTIIVTNLQNSSYDALIIQKIDGLLGSMFYKEEEP